MKEFVFGRFKRPIISIPRSNFEIAVEAIAIIGVFTSLFILLNNYFDLPDRIPTHYCADGAPNAYGGKWTLSILPVANLFMYSLLTLIRKIPHYYNYPWPITEENAPRMYQAGLVTIACVKMEIIWLFTYLEWTTVRVAMGEAQGVGSWFLPVTLTVLIGTLIIQILQMNAAK